MQKKGIQPLRGEINVPGDKSISHRSIILASLSEGVSTIRNFLDGEDCMRTIEAFRMLGVSIQKNGQTVQVQSHGKDALIEPTKPIYFGNSGTTARLMIGLLAGLPVFTSLYGDPSLTKRPMRRVTDPIKLMGANVFGREESNFLPLAIKGKQLNAINYEPPVKSAQVKSAVLLAGLYAKGTTMVTERVATRDHTENMLQAFGVELQREQDTISLPGGQTLQATDLYIPGDISSAAFFLGGAAIVNGSQLTVNNVGLNPTRTGILTCLEKMGAHITIHNQQVTGGEMIGDVTITQQTLQAIDIAGDIIPSLIDEIPILALIATQAEGTTVIRDAKELRLKETDRIKAIVDCLQLLGANIEPTDDGMIIKGKTPLHGGSIRTYGDHRIAMMGVIASMITDGDVHLDDDTCINISYPTFYDDLEKVTKT